MKPLPVIALLVATAPAFALEWKTTHLSLQTAPLQKTTEAWFDFTNTSAKPVKITGVESSCDCLDARASADVIAPGASGRIHAKFTLADRYGQLRRTIVVSTDEGGAPAALTVVLDIPEAATLTPRSVEWTLGSAAEPRTVDLTIAEGIELSFSNVAATSDAFTARLETVVAGRRYRVHITPKSTANAANAAFRIYGKTPAGQDLVFSAYGNVR